MIVSTYQDPITKVVSSIGKDISEKKYGSAIVKVTGVVVSATIMYLLTKDQ